MSSWSGIGVCYPLLEWCLCFLFAAEEIGVMLVFVILCQGIWSGIGVFFFPGAFRVVLVCVIRCLGILNGVGVCYLLPGY